MTKSHGISLTGIGEISYHVSSRGWWALKIPKKNLLSRSRNKLEICYINLRNLGCVNGAYTHMASIHSYTPEDTQKPWAIGYKTRQEWEKWPRSARRRKTNRDWMPKIPCRSCQNNHEPWKLSLGISTDWWHRFWAAGGCKHPKKLLFGSQN